MEQPKNIEISFFDSITSDKIVEISSDITEAGIDQFLGDGLLKDIPILGIAIKGYELAKKVSEMFFFKKILKFLFELKNVPTSERVNFAKNIELDEKKRRKAGETILVILNRLDDADKASIIGKLFKACIGSDLSYSEFLRLSYIVDKVFLDDLSALKNNLKLYNVGTEVKENLSLAGLLKQKIKDNRDREDHIRKQFNSTTRLPPTFDYEVNRFGEVLIKYGL